MEEYLRSQGVGYLELVVASSIGADLAMAFLTGTKLPVRHIFFDGVCANRKQYAPFLYFAIKSRYCSRDRTMKKICGVMMIP